MESNRDSLGIGKEPPMPFRKFASIFALFLFLGTSKACFAAGDASQCVMTVKKIELKNKAGDWMTLTDEKAKLDFFLPDPTIVVVNKGKIPPGIYVNCRITLSETLFVAGSDGLNRTKQGGEITVSGTAKRIFDLPGEITALKEVSPTWNKDSEGMITEHLHLDYEDSDDIMRIYPRMNFKKELAVKEGSTIKVTLRMDLKGTIYYAWTNYFNGFPAGDTMYFLPPKDVSELSVKVDAVTALATSDIEWAF
jgi:hypothetical protein